MTEPSKQPTQIHVCAFCNDQINAADVETHAKECALIPEDKKKSLAKSSETVVETIETEPRKQSDS